jgi:uncharacterized protein (TIGR03437 family)
MNRLTAALLVFSGVTLAQGTVDTYAGNDAIFQGSGRPATSAQILKPEYFAIDGQGDVYFSAPGIFMVLKVAPTGIVTVVAGNGLGRFGGDGGLATGASLAYPSGLALDSAGNLYIADSSLSNIRRVDKNGIITTIAGQTGAAGFAGDGGPATKALLGNPSGLAIDKSGNLYIADGGNSRVRMIDTTGTISTIAGNGTFGLTGDGGAAAKATLNYPLDLAVDAAGNLYIADTYNGAVRKISLSGIISTVAAQLSQPRGVAVDASGNVYVADSFHERILRIDSNGNMTRVAGTGQAGFSGDGSAATAAMFSTPNGVAVDSSGAVYVADGDNNRIRRFTPGGNVKTFAGTNTSTGDGGTSTRARLLSPFGVAVDASGNLYIADSGENRIRKVTLAGTITTVAGTGQTGGSGDNGPAISATLNSPGGVALDSAGNLYIADSGNSVIRRVDASTGNISLFAGNYKCCYAGTGTGGDGGPAIAATLFDPLSVAVDESGNVYLTDSVRFGAVVAGVAIRKVTTDGIIHPWAGGGSAGPGFGGDGGPPLNAQFGANYFFDIKTGPDGSLYVADSGNNRIRKIDPAGATINTVAGNGQIGASGDGGLATSAGLGGALSVVVDASGNLYIGGYGFVRKVTPGGTISTYAGNGQFSYAGDGGPAATASFESITGLALDSANNLYIADDDNNRVRQVQPTVSPAISLSSTSFNFTAAGEQTFTLQNTGQGTLNWAASATTAAGGSWLSLSPSNGSILAGQAGTTVTINVNPSSLAAGDYYGQILVTSPSAVSPLQSATVRLTVQTAGEDPPLLAPGGLLNAASFSLQTPVAPGTLVSIFGSKLTDASTPQVASTYPWPTQLGGTSVTIGGEAIPLYVVTPGQINAIVPFDQPAGTSLPVVVTRNTAVSAPQQVSMVSSQPGVFTQAQTGQGIGVIVVVHPDGSQEEAGGSNAAQAGDTLVIYCTGLGAVTPRAVAGFPAPPSPLSQVIDAVTLTIGGVDVPVFFAGPSPGFIGLYQVNATIPRGISPSAQAPLVLSQGGRSSATVTIPIE